MLNNRGSISLIACFSIIIISGLVLLQSASSFNGYNMLHQREKNKTAVNKEIQALATEVKKAVDMGRIDPTCQRWGGGQFKAKKVKGSQVTLCLPKKGGLCVQSERTGEKICTSPKIAAVGGAGKAKKIKAPKLKGPKKKKKNSKNDTSHIARTRITIPHPKEAVWRACNGETTHCLRFAICPPGKANCSESSALHTQSIQVSKKGDELEDKNKNKEKYHQHKQELMKSESQRLIKDRDSYRHSRDDDDD